MPKSLTDALAHVRSGEPADYNERMTWLTIRDQLRTKYKSHALNELKKLLNNIRKGSCRETEDAIDAALIDLQLLAPVEWVLDRHHKTQCSDGSQCYRLIGHRAIINPNGAFAITDLDGKIWVKQASVNGDEFTQPI